MHPPAHALRRRIAPVFTGWAACIGVAASIGCGGRNPGEDPPDAELFFPSGMLLDPRAAPGEPAKYLFVANGNNDLAYNAGTLVAIDLEAFFDAWSQKQDGAHTFAVEPYCTDDACVLDVGSPVDDAQPCRRLALLPQVVECDETPFIAAAQRIGDFATLLTHSCESSGTPDRLGCEAPRLWIPQRGDPSILYLDIAGQPDELPEIDCGSADAASDCDPGHRLMFQRNDDELTALPREPFNMVVSQQSRMAYVTHSDGVGLTLIDLDGIDDGSGVASNRPAIVDIATVFLDPSGTTGGFGLAERPCNPDQSPPAITLGCARPLVYAGLRYSRLLVSFTVQGVTFDEQAEAQDKCAGPDELGLPGKIDCDEKVRSQRLIVPGGLDPSSTGFRPILGDVAFADASGDELLVLQTGPGALLKLDTHIGTDGEPLDTPSAPPLELCDEPSRMHLFEDEGQRLALITCYRAALIYIVDLQSFRVLDSIVLGTGPYELEIDEPRKLLYVANNLEGSVTVIDLSRKRPTRFREIARIGLQEPFTR
jgi:DNA-binding beta-propeller fold protein YncE